MKADIPDSIIISRDKEGVLHHSYWTTDQQLIPFEDVEYICKDVLIEWAKENIDSLDRLSYGEFIAKLNSM